jgi:hypothetical protein
MQRCIIFINNESTYIYKINQAHWPCHLAHQPNKHISLSTSNHLAHHPIRKNYNSEGARPWGITIPSPYFFTILSAIYLQNNNKISKIFKNMWVLCPHIIFMLPCCVLSTVPGPLEFYIPYSLILELLAFPVQYTDHMHLQDAFLLHLNHIPIDYMIIIKYIFIKK